MTPVEVFARRLWVRERKFQPEFLQHSWDVMAKGRNFALLGEEVVASSVQRGSLTPEDRRDALALPGLRGVHWLLTEEVPQVTR